MIETLFNTTYNIGFVHITAFEEMQSVVIEKEYQL